jgi:hypothetical protein
VGISGQASDHPPDREVGELLTEFTDAARNNTTPESPATTPEQP